MILTFVYYSFFHYHTHYHSFIVIHILIMYHLFCKLPCLTLYNYDCFVGKHVCRIYDHQAKGHAFTRVEELLSSMSPDFLRLLQSTLADELRSSGFSEPLIQELVNAGIRCNYGQSTSIHAFVGEAAELHCSYVNQVDTLRACGYMQKQRKLSMKRAAKSKRDKFSKQRPKYVG